MGSFFLGRTVHEGADKFRSLLAVVLLTHDDISSGSIIVLIIFIKIE